MLDQNALEAQVRAAVRAALEEVGLEQIRSGEFFGARQACEAAEYVPEKLAA